MLAATPTLVCAAMLDTPPNHLNSRVIPDRFTPSAGGGKPPSGGDLQTV